MRNEKTTKRIRGVCGIVIGVGCAVFLAASRPAVSGAQERQKSQIPSFRLEPLWRKPLPPRWITGEVGGTCFDAQDHLFTVNRGNLTPKEQVLGDASKAVIEFDTDGQIVNSWGDRDILPKKLHGCFVDYQGNVWIAGNEDAIVQKYTHDGGKLLLQIGTKGRFDTSDGTIKSMGPHKTIISIVHPTCQITLLCRSAVIICRRRAYISERSHPRCRQSIRFLGSQRSNRATSLAEYPGLPRSSRFARQSNSITAFNASPSTCSLGVRLPRFTVNR